MPVQVVLVQCLFFSRWKHFGLFSRSRSLSFLAFPAPLRIMFSRSCFVLAIEFSLLTLPPAAGLSGPASSALPLALRALLLAFRFMLSVLALSRSRYFSLPRWTLASEGFNCRKRLRIAREELSVTSKHTADEHHLRISLTGSLRACAVQRL